MRTEKGRAIRREFAGKLYWKFKRAKGKGPSAMVATSEREKWKQCVGCSGVWNLRLTCFMLSLVNLRGVLPAKICSSQICMFKS